MLNANGTDDSLSPLIFVSYLYGVVSNQQTLQTNKGYLFKKY